MAETHKYTPGFGTEYVERYDWTRRHDNATSQNQGATGMFTGATTQYPVGDMRSVPASMAPPNVEFQSTAYPSVYREVAVQRDDRGKYTNPNKDYASKEYGRRLIYDPDHPDKMYASQWSSELADPNGPYSFPTTTGLAPEIPWSKDMCWREEGQQAQWATDQWKQWTEVAQCPPYDGHTDQLEYHKYKVQIN